MLSVLLASLLAALPAPPASSAAGAPDAVLTAEQQQERNRNRNRGAARARNADTDADTDSEDTDKDTDSDTDWRRGKRVVCFDRNGDGICDTKDRRADRCVDANSDGFCDAGRRRDDDDFCLDQDGDGRCDSVGFPGRFPRTLPTMITVGNIGQGRRTADVNRWLGGARLRVRYADANGDGTPELIRFLDPRGRVLQVWYDTDRDGRADRIEVYRDGKVARTVAREG